MKMRIMIMVGCLLTATLMMAQKREIAEAESYLKSGKNLDKAEKEGSAEKGVEPRQHQDIPDLVPVGGGPV